MLAHGYLQYQRTQTHTADGGELILMLYQGAIKFLGRASSALEAGKHKDAHENLLRAQEILVELMCSLNTQSGDIAVNLFKLYEYMHYRLVQANIRKDRDSVEEVASFLRQLLAAWQTAVQQTRSNSKSEAPLPAVSLAYSGARG